MQLNLVVVLRYLQDQGSNGDIYILRDSVSNREAYLKLP